MKILLKSMIVAAIAGCSMTAMAESTDNPVWKTVSASDNTTYAIKADGTLWAWGDNEEGQLGIGDTGMKLSSVPMQIGTDSNWKQVYGARGAGFFLKEDGTLWTAGSNEQGMSGVGDGVTKHTSLIQVGTDSDWAEVFCSADWCYTVLALKTDGSLWGWGSGSNFGLGQGNTNNSAVPIRIGTDNDWKTISVGASHILALKNDGSLWGWGFASYKQLMNPESGSIKVPTRLGDETWTAAYAIDNASYGVKADGTLWAWGDNTTNLLGLNSDMSGLGENETLPNVYVPTQVTAITSAVTDMSGCTYTRAVIAGGKVFNWGSNANGGLGDGNGEALEVDNKQYSYTPVEVTLPEGTVPVSISSGLRFSALLADNGTIYGWGANRWGQMGNHADDSRLTFCASPVEMGIPAPPEPGEYTFDAQNIPASLADAVRITLTGEWATADFQKLCSAIGATLGFPPVGNNKLVSVDMSQATIAPSTSMYVTVGFSDTGVFKMCKALESVKFPTNSSAANITNLQEAFMNCVSLKSCDISMLTGVSNIRDAFYSTAITGVNMSAWENVTKSEDAFGKCASLASVMLPANFTVDKFLFNSCTSLRLIDWSLFPGETAPAITDETNVFQDLDDTQLAQITMMVPEAAIESFRANPIWSKLNLQPVRQQEEGTYYIDGNNIPDNLSDARRIYLTGRWESPSFKALADALGNNSGTTGNTILEFVDMSQAEIAVGTNLNGEWPGALWGTQTKGIFQSCKTLAQVIMPAPDQASGLRSMKNAFYGCESLTEIDLSGCTGITDNTDAFYGDNALTRVTLPGNFTFASGTFDRCNSLSVIDWSLYEATEAPAFKTGSLPSRGKELTIYVPDAAYDSFVADTYWNGYNIVKASQSGIDGITTDTSAALLPVQVFDLSGRHVATLAPGTAVSTLPAGLYIIQGRKVLVR